MEISGASYKKAASNRQRTTILEAFEKHRRPGTTSPLNSSVSSQRKRVLTCTIPTHSLTLSSSPRTYIIPGVPPLLSNAKQSCFFAAAFRAATFLRDVMWCVRISAWYIVRKDAAGGISEGCMVVRFKTMVGAVSMPSGCGFGS
jgi:hypothetical protein